MYLILTTTLKGTRSDRITPCDILPTVLVPILLSSSWKQRLSFVLWKSYAKCHTLLIPGYPVVRDAAHTIPTCGTIPTSRKSPGTRKFFASPDNKYEPRSIFTSSPLKEAGFLSCKCITQQAEEKHHVKFSERGSQTNAGATHSFSLWLVIMREKRNPTTLFQSFLFWEFLHLYSFPKTLIMLSTIWGWEDIRTARTSEMRIKPSILHSMLFTQY